MPRSTCSDSCVSKQPLAKTCGYASVECESHGFAFAESEELRGKWFKLPAKLAQAPLSTLARIAGAGHRLSMRFRAPND